MIITNAQYMKKIDTEIVHQVKATIDGVECFVPINPNNRHYAEILKQVKEGKLTIKEAE